jgi:hypothetical protein
MIATEIPATMRPYSMAVAPEVSFKKRLSIFYSPIVVCITPKQNTERLAMRGHCIRNVNYQCVPPHNQSVRAAGRAQHALSKADSRGEIQSSS